MFTRSEGSEKVKEGVQEEENEGCSKSREGGGVRSVRREGSQRLTSHPPDPFRSLGSGDGRDLVGQFPIFINVHMSEKDTCMFNCVYES